MHDHLPVTRQLKKRDQNMSKPILFSTLSYCALRDKMLACGDFERGVLIRNVTGKGNLEDDVPFTDGERYLRLGTDVDDRECIVVGGTIDDREMMDMFDIGCALFDWGALRIKFVIPFLGYSTMERAVKPGEAVKAKNRTRILDRIPQAPMGNRFYFLDLHAPGEQYYLENRQAYHIYAKTIVTDAAKALAKDEFVIASSALPVIDATASGEGTVSTADGTVSVQGAGPNGETFILASTDAGRMKWIESLAKDLGVLPAFAYKHRDGDKTESLGISGPVAGKFVIIYDDMIRTGGSLINAALAYKAAGARHIAVISTHGILPGEALAKLQKSGLFTKIVVTDSLPRPEALLAEFSDFLQVETVAPLLVSNIQKKVA